LFVISLLADAAVAWASVESMIYWHLMPKSYYDRAVQTYQSLGSTLAGRSTPRSNDLALRDLEIRHTET